MHMYAMQAGGKEPSAVCKYVQHVAPWALDLLPGALLATVTAALHDAEKAGGLHIGGSSTDVALENAVDAVLGCVMLCVLCVLCVSLQFCGIAQMYRRHTTSL